MSKYSEQLRALLERAGFEVNDDDMVVGDHKAVATLIALVESGNAPQIKETAEFWYIPMYESERGWGGKIDGYTGPFDTFEQAKSYQEKYNKKWNKLDSAPDYYIAAQDPVKSQIIRASYGKDKDCV